jgi:hypothetical protein
MKSQNKVKHHPFPPVARRTQEFTVSTSRQFGQRRWEHREYPTYDKSITALLVVDPYRALGHSLTPASSLWMGG